MTHNNHVQVYLVWLICKKNVITCLFATQFTYVIYLFDAKTILICVCTFFTIVTYIYVYIDFETYPVIQSQYFTELIVFLFFFKLTLLYTLYYKPVN